MDSRGAAPIRSSSSSQFHHTAFNDPRMTAQPQAYERMPAGYTDDPQFDILEWYPRYQSCQRYFVEHSQHSGPVQAVAAFLNILLPFQRPAVTNPLPSLNSRASSALYGSLLPYIRRLVVTGLDQPGILHGFFGDDWVPGIGPLHEQERRNYLFAAKSGGWASVKKDYDMLPLETVPFLRPLQNPIDAEITAAEKTWSEWLAMEDWMVGPRAPEGIGESGKDIILEREQRRTAEGR